MPPQRFARCFPKSANTSVHSLVKSLIAGPLSARDKDVEGITSHRFSGQFVKGSELIEVCPHIIGKSHDPPPVRSTTSHPALW